MQRQQILLPCEIAKQTPISAISKLTAPNAQHPQF